MDTMRKYCKDELPKGCPDCQKEDGFGDICHAYQAYQQGRKDTFNILKDCCCHSHFTYDEDSHCSGYNYCMLVGFSCACCIENCPLMKKK